MIKENMILCKNPNIVTRVIDDETILMPIYKNSNEINCVYTLNQAASRAWELLDGKKSISQIKRKLLEEFNSTQKEIDRELERLLKDFFEIKAICDKKKVKNAKKSKV